jgi:hypothetical protein
MKLKETFDVPVPFGKIKFYLFKQILGRCVRQVDYALNDLGYTMRAVGHMKLGNDARSVTQDSLLLALDLWMHSILSVIGHGSLMVLPTRMCN